MFITVLSVTVETKKQTKISKNRGFLSWNLFTENSNM